MSGRSPTAGRRWGVAVGIGLLLAHAAVGWVLVQRLRGTPLAVEVRAGPAAPPGSPRPAVEARLPDGLRGRVAVAVDGVRLGGQPGDDGGAAWPAVAPGMHRIEWSVGYRGGFERRVGVTQLVGPYQDPAAPPCGLRLIVGQGFLDDGRGSPGTIADLVRRAVEAAMAGFDQWPIGRFRRVRSVEATWAALSDHPDKAARVRRLVERLQPAAEPGGYARVRLTLQFDNGAVSLEVLLVPALVGGQLRFAPSVAASIDLDRWIYRQAARLLDGDRFVSRVAQRELEATMVSALEAPPPLELGGGRQLRVDYCPRRPIAVASGIGAALPLAVTIAAGPGAIRPVALGEAAALSAPPRPSPAPLGLELDLDAVNALLHELWRSGLLDERLAAAGIEARFNRDPLVRQLLSVRLSDVRLALPPTASHDGAGFRLAAEATLTIIDGDGAAATRTPAHLHGVIGFDFAAAPASAGPRMHAAVRLAALSLTCEPRPGHLEPCYGDLVAAVRGRADALHGELTRLFTAILDDLLIQRDFTAPGQPAHFTVDAIAVDAAAAPPTGLLRVQLSGALRD
jgi:hypothetical protein